MSPPTFSPYRGRRDRAGGGLRLFCDGLGRRSDAKVAATAALWFGFAHLMTYLLYASVFGRSLTLLLLQFRQWPLPYALTGQEWLNKLHAKESGVPSASRSRSAR